MVKINIGCGQTPTSEWINFDNSFSLQLAKSPLITNILYRLRFLNDSQYQFINFARESGIKYGDVTKGLPLSSNSCEVIYSSHMIEHLDKDEADKFLKAVYRLLCPNGVVRIVVPDIEKQVKLYLQEGDADAFVKGTLMCTSRPKTIVQKLKLLMVGTRHHQWMYDGKSLSRLLEKHGFIDPKILPPGQTTITDPGSLNLYEREPESVYVEARKPIT
jgi:predicted SAM-dependent methyltransferase